MRGFIATGRFSARPARGPKTGDLPWPATAPTNSELILAAGLDFAAAHNMKLLAELYSKKNFDSDMFDSTELRVGYRVRASDILYTTVGAAFDIETNDPGYKILLALSFLLPPEKKVIKKLYDEE